MARVTPSLLNRLGDAVNGTISEDFPLISGSGFLEDMQIHPFVVWHPDIQTIQRLFSSVLK